MHCLRSVALLRGAACYATPRLLASAKAALSTYSVEAIQAKLNKQRNIVKALEPKAAGFKLDDTPGTSTVKMVKLMEDTMVEVAFDGHEEGYTTIDGANFHGVQDCVQMMVSVHKGPETMRFACLGTPALHVLSMEHRDEEDMDPDATFGPIDMDRLSEDVQGGVMKYLKSLRVDDQLSMFVCAYALAKQNSEKLLTMDKLKEFMR